MSPMCKYTATSQPYQSNNGQPLDKDCSFLLSEAESCKKQNKNVEAYNLYRQAADISQDPKDAFFHLANMLMQGCGVDRNINETIRYLKLAAHGGHIEAQASYDSLVNISESLSQGKAYENDLSAEVLTWIVDVIIKGKENNDDGTRYAITYHDIEKLLDELSDISKPYPDLTPQKIDIEKLMQGKFIDSLTEKVKDYNEKNNATIRVTTQPIEAGMVDDVYNLLCQDLSIQTIMTLSCTSKEQLQFYERNSKNPFMSLPVEITNEIRKNLGDDSSNLLYLSKRLHLKLNPTLNIHKWTTSSNVYNLQYQQIECADRLLRMGKTLPTSINVLTFDKLVNDYRRLFIYLRKNPDSVNDQDDSGKTLLHYAFEDVNISYQVLSLLCNTQGINFNIKDNNQNTPLHSCIERVANTLSRPIMTSRFASQIQYRIKTILELALEHGFDFTSKGKSGYPIMHLSVVSDADDLTTLNFFLKHEAFRNTEILEAVSNDELTSLSYCIEKNNRF